MKSEDCLTVSLYLMAKPNLSVSCAYFVQHCGDYESAYQHLNTAREFDLADRYVNISTERHSVRHCVDFVVVCAEVLLVVV